MKNYNVNNIVEYAGNLGVIYEPSFNGMWIRFGKGHKVNEVKFLTNLETADVKDVEISDWLLDRVFKRVEGHKIWNMTKDINQYWIRQDIFSNLYSFHKDGKTFARISTIRELQNFYNFWREYEEVEKYDGEELLFVDLDSELQKLFNL